MTAGELLKRHSLLAGLLSAVVPLSILLVAQFVWLLRLERAQEIANAAALDSFLGTVGTKVEYFYREAAERSLNLPASLFTGSHLDDAATYWKQRPAKGAKRLFLVDLTHTEFGNFLAFDPDGVKLYTPAASDESLAMILAANPLHMLSLRQRGMESAALTVDERNPDYRIILNPVLDDDGRVVGLAGMILDEAFLREKLLPSVITSTLAKYFPSAPEGEIAVTVKDGAGKTAVRIGDSQGRGVAAKARLGFVFADWELALHNPRATPQQWARAGFTFNAWLAVLLAAALIGGVALALRAADRAMKLSQMKSDFVSNVSHELRTPVASIRVFGELLRAGRVQEPERVREYGFAEGDVKEVVGTVVETFESQLAPRGFEIVVEQPAGPLPPVSMDREAIAQAFRNLLDNAVKYSGESRRIEVSLRPEPARVAVEVRDHGVGIASDEQRRVFERFHRVGTGLVHDVKGSGLGLSIVHHIVVAHGGEISVESEPGKGSTFTMRLPVSRRAA